MPSPYSLIRGIRKLLPGTYLTLDGHGKLDIHQFWSPRCQNQARLGRAAAAEAVHQVIGGAVRRQMRSDVPVGILLSGGVDSTIIAALAKKQTDQPLNTFSIAFRSTTSPIEDMYNADAHFARRVAATLDANHHEVICGDRDDIPQLLRELVVGLESARCGKPRS